MRNCCNINKKSKKCIRKDGKIFSLSRKYTRKLCRSKKGFSKKSSCSPFKCCKTLKGGGPKEEYSFILKQKLGEGEKGIYQPEIQERSVSRRTRSQTKQNKEELKKLERYVY